MTKPAPGQYAYQQEVSDLHHAATIVACYILQGRIGPIRPDDLETETLLAHLVLLARQQEPAPPATSANTEGDEL